MAPDSQDGDVEKFAKSACTSEIKSRYDVTRVSPYEIRKTNNGYVVAVSVTLAKGTTAKATCLANSNGGVKDVVIDEK